MIDEDDAFRRHILFLVQAFTFTLAIIIMIVAGYDTQLTGENPMEKTKYELKAEVETALVLPKTLQAETQMMPINGATIPMYAVYGRTDDNRRVWVATFVDSDEAMAWVQASKVFGRAVKGAVIAQQEQADGTGTDGRAETQKPN